MMSKIIARRYATALYEVAEENNDLESAGKDMSLIQRIFDETPQILDYCLQSYGDRRFHTDFVNAAFFPYIGGYTRETLKIAVKNGRLSTLPFLPRAFDTIRDEKSDTVSVVIETAHTYSDEIISLLAQKMRNRINKKIKIATKINPALLGGFRILWQNKILDKSAAGRLKEIRRLMEQQI